MRKIFILSLSLRLLYSQDQGLDAFENRDYKKSYDYYLNVLNGRKDDLSAKYGAGISAFKNQDIEIGKNYLIEVSKSENDFIASKAHYNLGNIYKDESKLKKSLYHYKKAIERNDLDEDARINFELVKNMLNQQNEDSNSQNDQSKDSDENQEDESEQNSQSESSDENQAGDNENTSQDDGNDESEENESEQNSQSESSDENQADDNKNTSKNDGNDENQEDENEQNKNSNGSDQNPNIEDVNKPSDQQIQAEAILNSLKTQEKINQKQKLLKVKARKLEKDW